MVIITGELRFAPENMERLRPAMRAVLEATRKEAGCLLYAYGEDVLEPGRIRIVERWESRAAFAAHQRAPHIDVWSAFIDKVGVLTRDLWAHESNDGWKI